VLGGGGHRSRAGLAGSVRALSARRAAVRGPRGDLGPAALAGCRNGHGVILPGSMRHVSACR
jgi:hypothetical protein